MLVISFLVLYTHLFLLWYLESVWVCNMSKYLTHQTLYMVRKENGGVWLAVPHYTQVEYTHKRWGTFISLYLLQLHDDSFADKMCCMPSRIRLFKESAPLCHIVFVIFIIFTLLMREQNGILPYKIKMFELPIYDFLCIKGCFRH